MHRILTTLFFLALAGAFSGSVAQDISGFWLGVTIPDDPKKDMFNYTLTLTQSNGTIGGTAQTSNPNVPFSGVVYVTGTLANQVVTFGESDKNGGTTIKDVCFWRGKLTYDATKESLIGPYENITNGTTCTTEGGGKMELYRIVVKSGTTFCKDKPVNLVVTGQNIRWYAAADKKNLLATGNTYSPKISQTTTFYITQTLYKNESPTIPITVTLTGPLFNAVPTNTGCDKDNGSIDIKAPLASNFQYSLNGGPFQSSATFTSLRPNSYTVTAKDTDGCQATQTVDITADSGPIITDLKTTVPRCETASGEVTVLTSRGKEPITYSNDYGVSYQSSPTFTKLPGGTYTFRARDANGCETNRATSLPAITPMTVLSSAVTPTSCGQANGQANLTVSGGKNPVQFSKDGQSFQPNGVFTGLPAGSYALQARDSDGCTTSESVSVAASTGPTIPELTALPEGCGLQNGALSITGVRYPSGLLYSLNGSSFQDTTRFSGLKGGDYILSIKDSANCIITQAIRIPLDCANLIHLPTAFSPNHDNVNDELKAYFAFPQLTILRFTVYDRWGTVVYNRANFALASGESIWDGQQNGQLSPGGTYTYRLDCLFPDGTQTSYRESIALLTN